MVVEVVEVDGCCCCCCNLKKGRGGVGRLKVVL